MSQRGVDRPGSTAPGATGAPGASALPTVAWVVGGIAGAMAVFALLVMVIGGPAGTDSSGSAGASSSSTTTAVATTVAGEGVEVVPTGRVAYLTADGAVWSASGAEAPVQVASGAALGPTGLGAVAVAPTGDLIAFVRTDGSLVTVPAAGGEPALLASDAVTADIGMRSSLAWNPTGLQLAYLAVGTADMAEPRPAEPPPLSASEGVFRDELPVGVLGNVVKVVDRTAVPVQRIGDPSTRSMVGIAASQSDDFMVLESINPATLRPYTLSVASSGVPEVTPTLLSADDPAFSPDGNFLVAVGPDRSGKELVRIALDTFARTTLVSADDICAPSVSPDSTRIVYGAGSDCSRLMLLSARGGSPIDITPPAAPGSATYRYGELSWTAEGHYVVFADCRSTDGPVRCGGTATFLDPDRRLVVPGPAATTVAVASVPLLGDLTLSIILAGPIEYTGTFPVDAETEAELTDIDETTTRIEVDLVEGDRQLRLSLQVDEGNQFSTGQMTAVDPAAGIDRTFLVLGTASAIGVRVVSLSGIWTSTDDLPFVSGEFRLAVRRR